MLYKNKQTKLQAQQDKREAIIGSVLGALLFVAMASFMVWHWWRVSQWLGGVFAL